MYGNTRKRIVWNYIYKLMIGTVQLLLKTITNGARWKTCCVKPDTSTKKSDNDHSLVIASFVGTLSVSVKWMYY